MKNSEKTMEKIVALCKGRGFIFSGSEIYGGLANTWDYGPLGVELKNNVKKAWWKKFVQENPYNVGLDAAILMNPQVWVASGHVGGFSDPLMDCKECKERFRADTVIYDISEGRGELGLLTAGSAVIQRIDRQGGRTILEHLPTGSVFGEMLMFENVAGDSITVVAAESCRVWFMSAEHLTRRCEKACTHHSRLVENMFHIMTGKAAALSERVEVLSRRSIREKLLCYFGLQTGGYDCGSFHLPFTLSALADYISADRSAMMRELRKMKEEHLVDIDRGQVTLHHALA